MSLFFVMGMAFFVGFVLIFAMSFSRKRNDDGIGTMTAGALPPFDRFKRVCQDILEAHKFEVTSVDENPEEQSLDIYCEFDKPLISSQVLAHCLLRPQNQVVSPADIVELSNVIIQGRLSKGIFITTGRFTEELGAISELAPMEFIDGAELERLCKEHKIPLIIPS